jgi:hypothetical protein
MSENKNNTNLAESLIVVVVVLYNLAIVAGTTFLIVHYDWSMWCYLLTFCFMSNVKTGKATEKDE